MSARMAELIARAAASPPRSSRPTSRGSAAQIEEVMDAGARVIHFDVMDGHFVPPITIGPLVAAAIADQVHEAGGAVDVHLMIDAARAPHRGLRRGRAPTRSPSTRRRPRTPTAPSAAIRELGCLAGVAINPGTPVETRRRAGAASPTSSSA